MDYRALIIVLAGIGLCLSASALTGGGDSATGPLDTVPPGFSAVLAVPAEAVEEEIVTLTFTASEALLTVPDVLVNGHPASYVSEAKSGDYTYEYEVQASDALGAASLYIGARDLVGNPGELTDAAALEIVEPEIGLPVHWWPTVIVLLLTGVGVLALRRRTGVALVIVFLLAAPVAQAVVVSNVSFVQQPSLAGGTEVVINYDLDSPYGPCDITVSLSKDGGSDGFPFAVTSVTGDSSGVTAGTGKEIVWDIATDYPSEDIPNAQIRVTADDGFKMPEMLPVASGAFQMGDVFGEGYPDELPVHAVALSAYEIGKFEVTNQQIADVFNWANAPAQDYFAAGTLNANTATLYGWELLNLDFSTCQITYTGTEFVAESRNSLSMADHPVVEITWYGAVAYCNWLSELAGLTPVYETVTWTANFANDGYHLPTEAQWERAAAYDVAAPTLNHWRYGQSSDTISSTDVNYNSNNPLGLTGWPYTTSVGWYDGTNGTTDSPSPAGCYDMSGSVFEWCHDWYLSNYYASSPGTDPEGPAGPGSTRVIRGGNWRDNGSNCRSANRFNTHPSLMFDNLGFRLARTLMVSPAVDSFAIDGGAADTPGLIVALDNACSDAPSEYMASEASDFSGATWEPYETAPSFTLSGGTGTKTVYLKVRNLKGESAAVSDTIEQLFDAPVMLPVAPGAFQMGDVFGGEGTVQELPVHTVTLSAYGIGKFEVTNQQIVDVYNWADDQGYFAAGTLDATTATLYGEELLDLNDAACQITYTGTEFVAESRDSLSMADHPVVLVTWYGAAAYCNWLSEIAGLTPVYETTTWTANLLNDGYHLPTEAQRERAAGHDAAAPTLDHWRYGQSSDSISQTDANCKDGGYANPLALTAFPYTTPVGWYDGVNAGTTDSPSPAGCYDMSGNVSEWCNDWYDGNAYGASPEIDPEGPAGPQSYRGLRGGSWYSNLPHCRSAARGYSQPHIKYDDFGFRVARTQMVTPSVDSFAIDAGGASTPGLAVTLDNTCSGVPSEYMASEASDFSGASWEPYETAPSFTLSAGAGTKTVYLKVRNLKGESAVASDAIETLGLDVPVMLSVAADDFDMGRTSAGDDASYGDIDERPRHTVTLSAYEIGKFEVTNQQIADVFNWANAPAQDYFAAGTLNANTATLYGQELLNLDMSSCQITYTGTAFEADTRDTFSMADHPVVAVTWYGAVAYCNWLSEIVGLTPVYDTSDWSADLSNDGYRLPTEAQWERAAAWDGAKHWIYGFLSDTLTGKNRCSYYDNNPNYVNPLGLTGPPYTSPVGWFDGNNTSPNGPVPTVDSPSPVGCYDMSGNVWEWCHDWYAVNYYSSGGPPWVDPEGPASGSYRILRGGAWNTTFFFCRSAYRNVESPGFTYADFGFRVARTP